MRGGAGALILMLLTAFLSGCAGSSAIRAAAQPTPIPWVGATPGSLLAPTPTPVIIPPGTPACDSRDLTVLFGGSNAMTGGQLAGTVMIGNRSGAACFLNGVPSIRLLDAHNTEIPVHLRVVADLPSGPVLLLPHTEGLQAGIPTAGTASLLFWWPTHDGVTGTCSPAPREGTVLQIQLDSARGSLRVPIVDPRNHVKVAACGGELSVTAFESAGATGPSPSPNPVQSLTNRLGPTGQSDGSRYEQLIGHVGLARLFAQPHGIADAKPPSKPT